MAKQVGRKYLVAARRRPESHTWNRVRWQAMMSWRRLIVQHSALLRWRGAHLESGVRRTEVFVVGGGPRNSSVRGKNSCSPGAFRASSIARCLSRVWLAQSKQRQANMQCPEYNRPALQGKHPKSFSCSGGAQRNGQKRKKRTTASRCQGRLSVESMAASKRQTAKSKANGIRRGKRDNI